MTTYWKTSILSVCLIVTAKIQLKTKDIKLFNRNLLKTAIAMFLRLKLEILMKLQTI